MSRHWAKIALLLPLLPFDTRSSSKAGTAGQTTRTSRPLVRIENNHHCSALLFPILSYHSGLYPPFYYFNNSKIAISHLKRSVTPSTTSTTSTIATMCWPLYNPAPDDDHYANDQARQIAAQDGLRSERHRRPYPTKITRNEVSYIPFPSPSAPTTPGSLLKPRRRTDMSCSAPAISERRSCTSVLSCIPVGAPESLSYILGQGFASIR